MDTAEIHSFVKTQAPIGEKRFAHPEPVDGWSAQYNATRFGNSCWQTNDDTYGEFKGSAMWNPNTKVQISTASLKLITV